MDDGYKRWYKNCFDSLFDGKEENWVYRVVKAFTEISEVRNCEEEIIKDTKFRYRALLDYSLDVFTGDRMGNKSYQLPFALYSVAKNMFKEPVAAIASEAVMMVGNWDYRVRSNLLRLILFDDNPADSFLEKMTIFFMSLEECRELEDIYMADCKDISFAEYYPELIIEMGNMNYECVRGILHRIRKSPEKYYKVYDNVLWTVCESGVPDEMKGIYRRRGESKSEYSSKGMERDLEEFIKNDMYDYIRKGYVASYNPFWLFGSGKYKENIDYIHSRKNVFESDMVWIQYLFLKSQGDGKQIKCDSLLRDNQMKKRKVSE